MKEETLTISLIIGCTVFFSSLFIFNTINTPIDESYVNPFLGFALSKNQLYFSIVMCFFIISFMFWGFIYVAGKRFYHED